MSTSTPATAKVSKVTKTDWSGTGKVKTRSVSTQTRAGVPITYPEYNLNEVSDLNEAASLLKVKGARAVRALIIGTNKLSRRKVANEANIVGGLAEHLGVSIDEARAAMAALAAKAK